jgi:16S rRNA (guanine527-N7)-methyltransferase
VGHDWSRDRFAGEFGVSRETLDRFDAYGALLAHWNRSINVVSPASLGHLWTRHFADSAQLWRLAAPAAANWVDLGSGGGLPGIVVAILGANQDGMSVHLVESDRRKAEFLRQCIRELSLSAKVHPVRIEFYPGPRGSVVSARALAPLSVLLSYLPSTRSPGGIALFPKGRSHEKELDAALALWNFEYRLHPSRTDPEAAIIEIGAVHGRR